MAGLKVFVSSTCVDLGAQRSQVRSLLDRMGYEPVMSEHSDVLFDHRLHTHTSCIKEISNADMVILLIGSRFGGTATPEALSDLEIEDLANSSTKSDGILDKHKLSITQVEVMKAIESDVPLFAFVDSKVYSDHHLYQKNKSKHFANEIIYPSIEKPETAKYIFEFINFITHRFANNAITPYASFSDIEDHLVKQWSMIFQRLLREERGKAVEGRRADAMLEQIQDLKAAMLQSISAGTARDVARSVLRYRRLADFLLAMRRFNPALELSEYQGSFDDLLADFGVVDIRFSDDSRNLPARTYLVRNDDTYLRVRVPDRRFMEFAVEWKGFSQLDKDTKIAVLEGVEENESVGPTMVMQMSEPYREEGPNSGDLETGQMYPQESTSANYWTDEKVAALKSLWDNGFTASQIAAQLGGIGRNSVIGKAHRLGLRSSRLEPSLPVTELE